MPKRFDKAIKVLKDEQHRIAGKIAFDAVEKGHSQRTQLALPKLSTSKKL